MSKSEYVYFIYKRDIEIGYASDLCGKIGRGCNNRFSQYTTYYGVPYTVAILPTSDPNSVEKSLKEWGQGKGYIRDRSEILSTIIYDTFDECKKNYITLCNKILGKLSSYGSLIIINHLGLIYDIRIRNHIVDNIWIVPDDIKDKYINKKYSISDILNITRSIEKFAIDETIKTKNEYIIKMKLIDDENRRIFNTYIDKSYSLYEKTYTLWTKGKHDEIKKIANMARGIDINMKNDVFKLFELGGTRINTISDLKSTEVILRYTTRDRDKLEPICKRLAIYYGITVDRAFWKWIGKLFGDKLLINGSQLPDTKSNKDVVYQYKLHIADWLYWFIIGSPFLYSFIANNVHIL